MGDYQKLTETLNRIAELTGRESMKTITVASFFEGKLIGISEISFLRFDAFKRSFNRFPRSYLRKIMPKYGFPKGEDKDVYIKALWEDPRKLTVTMRWKREKP